MVTCPSQPAWLVTTPGTSSFAVAEAPQTRWLPNLLSRHLKKTKKAADDVPEKCILESRCTVRTGDMAHFRHWSDITQAELVQVTDCQQLPSVDSCYSCFHLEVDVTSTAIEHAVNGSQGNALSVYASNPVGRVAQFIETMELNADESVSIEKLVSPSRDGTGMFTTVNKLFTYYLDIFGQPSQSFFRKLVPYAHDSSERVVISQLTARRKTEGLQTRQADVPTFADYLSEFKSLTIPVDHFVELIPPIKQRVYPICSSSDHHPGKCQLLVTSDDFPVMHGMTNGGVHSSLRTITLPGTCFIACSTYSVMQMPQDKTVHVFMAGFGIGLAPFRAFIEQRKFEKTQGHKVGAMTLFLVGHCPNDRFPYRDDFEQFEAEGLVKCYYSSHGGQKWNSFHQMFEEEDVMWKELGSASSHGCFFLSGPGALRAEKDAIAALLAIFETKGGMSCSEALETIERLRSTGRYVAQVR
eukprot:TRINITY_DN20277_c1_g1_i1.p1 TRINITY_DN20277_c1_g1~~TRINITY_DN20277_c1_g1_i1.p1  ORF type:complete len:469 (+),score=69.75 TRINITY_DN20277_c1_g1_i1:287-1693(+)